MSRDKLLPKPFLQVFLTSSKNYIRLHNSFSQDGRQGRRFPFEKIQFRLLRFHISFSAKYQRNSNIWGAS